MARHSVIIGVGGTGQYVLTLIKKELLEINHGKMPVNVKLLAFDTMPEAAVGGKENLPTNVISIQNVQLETDVEFIGLSGNGWQLGEAAVHGKAPHISRWFDAAHYQQRIPPAIWDLAAGAARIRQFGRLAFFMKVQDIRARIQNAFTAINGMREAGEEVEVIIISSFAGGTGAGMFVDMGVMCRDLGNIFNNQLKIRGVFVLPTAFINLNAVNEHGRHMMARSFAAWRELDRYMNLGPTYGAHKNSYQTSGFDINVRSRPFDECFLVDTRSDVGSLEAVDAKNGVFPVIANFISLVLDEVAGLDFAQKDANFIVPLTDRKKQGYTALRTYTIKVPIYYDMEIRALSFSKDLLERWLAPVTNQAGNVTGLADNKNNEQPNTRGRDSVIPFLEAVSQRVDAVTDRTTTNGSTGTNASLSNTAFLPHIAAIYKLKNIPQALRTQKDTDAMGGYVGETVSTFTYAGKLVLLPSDASQTKITVNKVEREVDVAGIVAECNTHLWDEVQTSDQYGDHPVDAVVRFQDPTQGIPAFEKKHFGAGTGDRGRFGNALSDARLFQVARFRELLRQWILNALNGTTLPAFVGLGGKLGYVKDFCDEMVSMLDFFTSDYLADVKKLREGFDPMTAARTMVDNASVDMETWAGKKCAFFFTNPRAYSRQNRYIVAVDDRMQVTRDDMVLDEMMNTSKDMLDEARKAQASVSAWVKAFATGGQNTLGLLKDIEGEILLVDNNLKAERAANPTQLMTQERHYQQDPLAIDEEMKRLSWNVDFKDGFEVKCQMLVPTDKVNNQGQPINKPAEFSSADTLEGLDRNKEIIKAVARNVYRQEWEDRMALDEMMKMEKNSTVLANQMKNNSDVLLRLDLSTASQGMHEHSVYLRVMNPNEAKSPGAVGYIEQVNDQICRTLGMPITDLKVLSDDRYKVTLLRTTHRIQDADFDIWDALRKEYISHITSDTGEERESSARLHICPAECNTVRYESQLNERLDKPYRAFHPEVVMLMEQVDRVSIFFRCYAYGFIKNRPLPNSLQKVYYLDLPEIGSEYAQKVDLITNTLTDNGQFKEPTWFDIINAFAMIGHAYNSEQKIINFDSLRKAMAMYEAQLRATNKLQAKIEAQINGDTGMVKNLNREAESRRKTYMTSHPITKLNGWTWNDDGQEYFDLEDLAHMMLLEVLSVQHQQVVTPID